MRRNLIRVPTTAVLWFVYGSAPSQPNHVAKIGVYGTDALDVAAVESQFGDAIEEMAAAQQRGDWDSAAAAEERVVEQLLASGDFASVELALYDYSGEQKFAMIDVVESADQERRAPFRDRPNGDLADPGGLVSLWREYEQEFLSLAMSRDLVWDGDCEVIHCLVPFAPNPDLLPYLAKFDDGVAAHEDALYEVARHHRFGVYRGASVYLLAHSDDKLRLLGLLREAMFDSDSYVRNNAMRVMAWMVERAADLPYPVSELAQAMDFAAATDRNKATFVLAQLARSPSHRDRIRELAVPRALRLLRQELPINHDPAYELLKNVSGEDFASRDYDAWERYFLRRQ